MERINVFIPAAGFAERLRPLSAQIPKPLLPVLGRPVLDRVLENVSAALPVRHIGINMHYRWESLSEYAAMSAYSAKIVIFHERQILGTGGALKNAASLLGATTFIVHNADILSGIDLKALLDHHRNSGNIATLAVHDYPEINTVWIDEGGRVRQVGKHVPEPGIGLRPVTYTGVAAYSPEFLDFLKEGRSEVVEAWLSAASSGLTVGTVDVSGTCWTDIGTPAAYASAVFHALDAEGEMLFVHPSVKCGSINVGGRVVIEGGSSFEGPASLRDCIILPGTTVRRGEHIEEAVAGPGFRVPIDLPFSTDAPRSAPLVSVFMKTPLEKIRFALIGMGGSDRKYYRIKSNNRTAILLECQQNDPDYRRQIIYTRFFAAHSVPVPRLIAEECEISGHPASLKDSPLRALFEDLGDLSLYSWVKCRRNPDRVEILYRKVIDILVTIHSVALCNVLTPPAPDFRIFDYDHLRWETEYFIEKFVYSTRGLMLEDKGLLYGEFDRLARVVDSAPKTIVHRDFQSQNIMVAEGDTPKIIDYQGARIGPPAYDLVSLLWDPYVRLDKPVRQRLLLYYLDKMNQRHGDLFDAASFRATFLPCRLQRHMQALGAYGFLSKEKGKRYFLKHVPAALSYLREETEEARSEYPALHRLVGKL